MDRLTGSLGREMADRVALPVLALEPDLGDLNRAVALGERSERSASFDRLKRPNEASLATES